MSQKIQEALQEQFKEHEVVFWYDPKNDFLEVYNNLDLGSIEKIHVEGNEFAVKYRVTTKEAKQKLLLYFNKKRPKNEDNWLLDLELAYHTFNTDQEAIILQELGLDYNFIELVNQHRKFFDSKERIEKLKELLGKDDTHNDIRAKMVAVTFNTEHVNITTFILEHCTAFANNNEKIIHELERFQLSDFYWKTIEERFGYHSENPKIYDFLIEVFSSSVIVNSVSKLSTEARFLLLVWKDMLSYRDAFVDISNKIANDLQIESSLNNIEIEKIIEEDLFELTDTKIIHELIQRLVKGDISNENIQSFIKKRENKFWYSNFKAFYQSIGFAAQLKQQLKEEKYQFSSLKDGLTNYTESHYEIDYLYRKFILSYRATNQNSILNELAQSIEKLYTNNWLLPYNNSWQEVVDNVENWEVKEPYSQQSFFKQHIQQFVDKKQRVFVIISDALRYECGKELTQSLLKENRYEATIDGAIASLPSYTQLGMASLLPHSKLEIEEGTDNVIVDGMSSAGVNGRAAILQKNTDVRATAITASEIMKLNTLSEGRDFVKEYDVIYIYHNRIDKVGDDKTTEDKLVEAVEEELDFLKELLKKIANMNGTNMIITSDHGFLYQYFTLDESDFMQLSNKQNISKLNRRFVMGKTAEESNYLKTFSHQELGLESEGFVGFPKSVNRLRVKGAGSKFVHGGVSLQEVIIPVIKVNKKRQDTNEQVTVDVINNTDKVTTNLLAVSFIQNEAVGKSVIGKTIKAVIVAEDGTEISDTFTYTFNSEEENPRQREVKHRFLLTALASSKYKNQRVKLLLQEPMERSNKWKVYKEYYYTLNISFTSDFDGF